MKTHVVCQILCSPVQSVLLGVHDTCSVPDTVESSTVSYAVCVPDDTCSVSVTVQSSTVSFAGCARPYVNINSK